MDPTKNNENNVATTPAGSKVWISICFENYANEKPTFNDIHAFTTQEKARDYCEAGFASTLKHIFGLRESVHLNLREDPRWYYSEKKIRGGWELSIIVRPPHKDCWMLAAIRESEVKDEVTVWLEHP